MDYDLSRLGPRDFEHLSQALTLAVLGPHVSVFGDGPDGGREATFDGVIDYPRHRGSWNGYGVVQAKYRQRLLGTRSGHPVAPRPTEIRARPLGDRSRRGPATQAISGVSDLVFTTLSGAPLEPNDISKRFPKLCAAAGLRRIRLHDLRHTCASLLLAQGHSPRVVMEILGHSSLELTMNIYGHVRLEAQREAIAATDLLIPAVKFNRQGQSKTSRRSSR